MIKPLDFISNFNNEYQATIKKENRGDALRLLKKMSDSKPGLMQEAKIEIRQELNGGLDIYIRNTSAFDNQTKSIIIKYLNSIRD